MKFIQSNGEMTVFDDSQWPQYMSCDRETYAITPEVKYQESDLAFGSFKRFVQELKELFIAIPEFIKALISSASF
jgi:hypothetical protein